MEATKTKVIFFVDDESQVQKAVKQTLEQLDDCRIECFGNGKSCLRELKRTDCDLLIADVSMPVMDGLELLAQAKAFRPKLSVVLVTGYGDIPMAVKAVKAGADDFIEKPLDEKTFLPIVQAVLERSLELPKPEVDIKILTKKEILILRLVGQGMTNKEIALKLDRSVRTIENHRHRLMRKLGTRNAVDLLKKAINLGLASSQ